MQDYHVSNLAYDTKIETVSNTLVGPTYTCFMSQILEHTEPRSFRDDFYKPEGRARGLRNEQHLGRSLMYHKEKHPLVVNGFTESNMLQMGVLTRIS